jgi:hypothetical protein
MLKFGFGWDGALESNKELQEGARNVMRQGHQVHLVPATEIFDFDVWQNRLVDINVGVNGVWPVRPGVDAMDTARRQAFMCLQLGIGVFYDNNEATVFALNCFGIDAYLARLVTTLPSETKVLV